LSSTGELSSFSQHASGSLDPHYDVGVAVNGRAPRTLIVPLSGEDVRAVDLTRQLIRADDAVLFPLSYLADGRRKLLRNGRVDQLAIVGAPPEAELGYGLAAFVALLGRPREVSLIDLQREQAVSASARRFLLRTLPFATAQLAASLVAVAGQRAAVPLLRRKPRLRGLTAELGRLVYVRPSAGAAPMVGGSVTHTHEVIRALELEGVSVDAYTTDATIARTAAEDPAPPCEWRVVRAPRALNAITASAAAGGDLALIRAALPATRSADAIYQRHRRFSLVGAALSQLSGKPLILEYNGSEEFATKYWSSKTPLTGRVALCEEASLRTAARILVVSNVDRLALIERGIEPTRIVENPNGVDAERFAVGGGGEVRRRHGIRDDAVVAGFVGTFGPWHGAPVLGRAFSLVAREIPNLHLLLVGDGREREPTLQYLRQGGVESRVIVAGRISPPDVSAYLDACDLLISPHVPLPAGVEFFGSPTKLFEYMAAGKGIVASDLGQIGDVLVDRETALLVEPGSEQALAAAIRTLAGDPELRSELGARARAVAIERHSWRENGRRVTAAYRELVREMQS
jgi:glycosyltransferase involved in cell wall biosynthesis